MRKKTQSQIEDEKTVLRWKRSMPFLKDGREWHVHLDSVNGPAFLSPKDHRRFHYDERTSSLPEDIDDRMWDEE